MIGLGSSSEWTVKVSFNVVAMLLGWNSECSGSFRCEGICWSTLISFVDVVCSMSSMSSMSKASIAWGNHHLPSCDTNASKRETCMCFHFHSSAAAQLSCTARALWQHRYRSQCKFAGNAILKNKNLQFCPRPGRELLGYLVQWKYQVSYQSEKKKITATIARSGCVRRHWTSIKIVKLGAGSG